MLETLSPLVQGTAGSFEPTLLSCLLLGLLMKCVLQTKASAMQPRLSVCTEEHVSDSVLSYTLLPGLSHVISAEMVVWSQAGSKGIEALYALFCSSVSL